MGWIRKTAAECAVFAGLLICASPIDAQTVQQSGSVTQNHIATWATNGVIKDGGAVAANQSLMGGSATSQSAGSTVYCGGSGGCGTTVAAASQVPFTGTLSNLSASVATAPGSGHSVVVTVYTGAYGSATASSLTSTIANTSTSCTDSAHQVNLPLGTTWTIQFVVGAGATSTGGQAGSMQFTSSSPPAPTTPYVLQSGNITSGHLAGWITNGVIGDIGATSCPSLGAFLVGTGNGGQCSTIAGSTAFLNGTLTVSPAFTAGTVTQALNATVSGPTSNVSGPVTLNLFTGTLQGTATGSGTDSYGLFNTGLFNTRINTTVAAGNTGSIANGLVSALRVATTSSIADQVSLGASWYSNVAVTSTGASEAFNAVAVIDNGGSTAKLVAAELDVAINTGATATNRIGVSIVSQGNVNGSTRDAAIVLGASSSGPAFSNLILLSNTYSGVPVSSSTSFIGADTSMTIGNFINASNITVSTNIFNFPNYSVAGSSLTTLNAAGITNTSTDRLVLQNTTAATGTAANQQQWSPRLHFIGQGWKNNATAQSETVDWIGEAQATFGGPQPNTVLAWSGQINGGGYTPIVSFQIGSTGNASLLFNAAANKNSNLIYQDNGANVWYLQNLSGTSDQLTLVNSDGNGNATILTVTNSTGLITLNQLSTDSGHTTRTVCQDTTSKAIYFGSGSAGVCLGTSSARYKHDIEPLQAGIDQIMALAPVSYKYNADYGNPDKELYGFTAEQGATVLPDLVNFDSAGRPQSFDYLGVVPVLVRAVQQLEARLAAVEAGKK